VSKYVARAIITTVDGNEYEGRAEASWPHHAVRYAVSEADTALLDANENDLSLSIEVKSIAVSTVLSKNLKVEL
jgi:hypothetical protein